MTFDKFNEIAESVLLDMRDDLAHNHALEIEQVPEYWTTELLEQLIKRCIRAERQT